MCGTATFITMRRALARDGRLLWGGVPILRAHGPLLRTGTKPAELGHILSRASWAHQDANCTSVVMRDADHALPHGIHAMNSGREQACSGARPRHQDSKTEEEGGRDSLVSVAGTELVVVGTWPLLETARRRAHKAESLVSRMRFMSSVVYWARLL